MRITASFTALDNTKRKLQIRELVLFAMLGSLAFSAKLALMWLPNIEPVSLLVMLYAVRFGKKSLYPVYVYVLLEFLVYGFNLWAVCYLYVWPILAYAAYRLRSMESAWGWALLSACFGLFFGALCAPVYLVTGGLHAAAAWWISGIPFDLLHCAGNFLLALVLFKPLRKLMERWKDFSTH